METGIGLDDCSVISLQSIGHSQGWLVT